MNGVRRLLGGGGGSNPSTPDSALPPLPPIAPLSFSGKPNWPPSSPTESNYTNSPPNTAALSFRKNTPRSPLADDDAANASFHSSRSSGSMASLSRKNSSPSAPQSPGAGPSSPSRVPVPNRVSQLSRKSMGSEGKRSSQMLNVRDDLLLDLLASEAVVDSRGCQILSAEEVEELKKEQQVLASRLVAMNKKVALETKMRDAAVSLSKLNATSKAVSKQTSEQLDTANRKLEAAQKELWRMSERAAEVQRKLLEHRAGVLSHSVRALERKNGTADNSDTSLSGYSTPNRSSQMSPITASSATSVHTVASKSRFDGAHFFAGHAEAMLPHSPRVPPLPTGAAVAVNGMNVSELEAKLQEATTALEAATTRQMEMEQELSLVRLEKEEVETSLGMQLRVSEESSSGLQGEIDRLKAVEDQMEQQQAAWMSERSELEDRKQEVEELRRKVGELEALGAGVAAVEGVLAMERGAHLTELQKRDEELAAMKQRFDADRTAWDTEKAMLMSEMNVHVAQLQEDGSGNKAQLDGVMGSLGAIMQAHGIELAVPLAAASPAIVAAALGGHLKNVKTKLDEHAQARQELASQQSKLEDEVRNLTDRCQTLGQQLEQNRQERDDAKGEVRSLEVQLQAQTAASIAAAAAAATAAASATAQPPVEYKGDAAQIVAQLKPIWAVLPSSEARASKLGSRSFRTGSSSPTSSPVSRNGGVPPSLSEMDVRSLKALYDPKGYALNMNSGGTFSVESFLERVQALVADDRALIERLIRFAQAHDLLKKNAERAQKLAQDSNVALETYQKQVKTLEERNISLMTQQAELQDELSWLQETVERVQAEKLEIETQAADQAETCAQLTEANNTLSAKALIMADEAASTTDSVRRQLETQLAECKTGLKRVNEELDSARQSAQTQQMALLEEINNLQTENTNLRNQVRAMK